VFYNRLVTCINFESSGLGKISKSSALTSRPHPLLAASSIAVVVLAALLPFIPVGTYFGFVRVPAQLLFILGGMVVAYLLLMQWVKRFFYLRLAPS